MRQLPAPASRRREARVESMVRPGPLAAPPPQGHLSTAGRGTSVARGRWMAAMLNRGDVICYLQFQRRLQLKSEDIISYQQSWVGL